MAREISRLETIARSCSLGLIVASFPAAIAAVYGVGVDRQSAASALAGAFTFGLYSAVSAPWWAGDGTSQPAERLERSCMTWLGVTYTIHLTWELGYLVFYPIIVRTPDSPWTYAWWAYIDGGDLRYSQPTESLLALEALSVVNGLVGVLSLTVWQQNHPGSRARCQATLALMATSVVHLYSATFYFATELISGLKNVDTSTMSGLWLKFIGSNSPWVVMPWLVLQWGCNQLLPNLKQN